ncbi:MAG: type IV pili methyl-accepting chemotaxis transducer N-terminal domain-containing protein, partial [Pseudomonadota bacterium]
MPWSNKAKDIAAVVPSPDTEFGMPGSPQPASVQALPAAPESEDNAPLRLGNFMRRKRSAAPDEPELDYQLPLIGHLSLPRQLRILLAVVTAGILVTVLALWQNTTGSAVAALQVQVASDALMHSQRVGKAAPNAVQGNTEAFAQLKDSRAQLTNDLMLLSNGGRYSSRTIPAAPANLVLPLSAARKKWSSSDNAAGTILKLEPELAGFDKSLRALDTLSPELLTMTEDLLTQKVTRGGSAYELAALGRLMMLTQRLARSVSEFLGSGGVRPDTAFQLGRDTTNFRAIIDGFENGSDTLKIGALRDPDLRNRLGEIKFKFDKYQKLVASVLDNVNKFTAAKAAEQSIFYENEEIKKLLTGLQRTYRVDQESTDAWFWLMVISSIFTLATAGSISRVMLQDSRNRTRGADARRQEAEAMRLQAQAKEEEAKATNDQNQAAILRLMNELQEVADGDLTIHATVSEDITGAIADSVNYTVEELRGLVGRVTATAEQVTSASGHAQEISSELLSATQQQSREIEDASATV